jgi:hypothetical protein
LLDYAKDGKVRLTLTDKEMKKVKVNWCEMHYYEAEIEVPDNLSSSEEEVDWVISEWGMGLREPYEICTDWDSFEVEDVEE